MAWYFAQCIFKQVAIDQGDRLTGSIVFEPGEYCKEFTVNLIDDHEWDETRGFIVDLIDITSGEIFGDDSSVAASRLSKDLWRAMVFIVDISSYPSDKYKDVIVDGAASALNGASQIQRPGVSTTKSKERCNETW